MTKTHKEIYECNNEYCTMTREWPIEDWISIQPIGNLSDLFAKEFPNEELHFCTFGCLGVFCRESEDNKTHPGDTLT